MLLKLNTWQRVQLELLIGAAKGPASTIRKAVKLLDCLEMNDAEKAQVGFRQEGGLIQWDNLEHVWTIEVKDGNLASFLRELVRGKTDWTVNRNVIGLFDQLGIQDE